MEWEPAAEGVLRALVDMVPETMRQLAKATARDESELAAQDRGAAIVAGEDVIRGWIRTTPPEQRDDARARPRRELHRHTERSAGGVLRACSWSSMFV